MCALSLFASLAASVTMTTALAAQREVEGELMVLGVMERERDRQRLSSDEHTIGPKG